MIDKEKVAASLFEQWLRLPGNGIYANLDMQKRLPGMNARTFNAGPPVPGASGWQKDVMDAVMGADTEGMPIPPPEELPPVLIRQWKSPASYLREQHPAVQIMPFPTLVLTVTSDGGGAGNTVHRVAIPGSAQLIRISGTTPNIWVSESRFVLPLVGSGAELQFNPQTSLGPIAGMIGDFYWECAGIGELFVGIPIAGQSVSISLWEGQSPRV